MKQFELQTPIPQLFNALKNLTAHVDTFTARRQYLLVQASFSVHLYAHAFDSNARSLHLGMASPSYKKDI